jgi:hypothetical protein
MYTVLSMTYKYQRRLTMRNINLSLFDSNYTVRANANLSLSKSQDKELKEFFKKAEENLSWEGSNQIILKGLGGKPVVMTVTEIE